MFCGFYSISLLLARRKQGGSQGLNDNAKGNAKSAGAQLRRYGEQALRDVRFSPSSFLDFILTGPRTYEISSKNGQKKLTPANESGSEPAALIARFSSTMKAPSSPRAMDGCVPSRFRHVVLFVSYLGFSLHRLILITQTQSELSRCLMELTRAKTSHLTEDALRAQDEAYLASLPKPKPIPVAAPPVPEKPKPVKLSKEEENFREKWTRLLEMVSKGRLDPLKSFWEREGANLGGVDALIPDWAGERKVTVLQLAAHAGHEDVTSWLLEDLHADPTVDVPLAKAGDPEDNDSGDASDSPKPPKGSRRTAYDLARNRAVRDVFRRCAGAHPDWWDWFGVARVPSALSKEMEEERDEKKKVRRKGLKDKVKEREGKVKPAPEPEPKHVVQEQKVRDPTGPRKLGGASGAVEGIAGLTPEMRARVERERRARAAEARLNGMMK